MFKSAITARDTLLLTAKNSKCSLNVRRITTSKTVKHQKRKANVPNAKQATAPHTKCGHSQWRSSQKERTISSRLFLCFASSASIFPSSTSYSFRTFAYLLQLQCEDGGTTTTKVGFFSQELCFEKK